MANTSRPQQSHVVKRAKRITRPIFIGFIIICFIAANSQGGLWWLALMLSTIGALWSFSSAKSNADGERPHTDNF